MGDIRGLVALGYKRSVGGVKVESGGDVERASEKIDLVAATIEGMADDDRVERFITGALRSVGNQLSEAKRAFGDSKRAAEAGLPRDADGRARIVCRRHAERRAVSLDSAARPECFDPDHPDCQGCVEDIADDSIETW